MGEMKPYGLSRRSGLLPWRVSVEVGFQEVDRIENSKILRENKKRKYVDLVSIV